MMQVKRPEFKEYFDKNFNIPDLGDGQQEMWADVQEVVTLLNKESERIMNADHIEMGSAAFKEYVNREKFESRTEKAIASLTLVGDALCIRVTHIPTEDAILIGPREALNPQLPRTSRFQKYVSRIFTFSGRHTDYKVRGRNLHLVRVGNADQASSVEFHEKPLKWLSFGWYKHYVNAALSKPELKHLNSSLLSTVAEMGMLYGLQQLNSHYNPAKMIGPEAFSYAAGFSFSYGLFANGIRMINQYGPSKFFRFLKLSAWNLAYTVPFAILVGQEHIVTVVGLSFMVNKSADVHWSQIVKFDETLRTMPGDFTVASKEIPSLKVDTNLKFRDKILMRLKFKTPEATPEIPFGSRVTIKSIWMRMPRFFLKAYSIVDPVVGLSALLISIPVMSIVAYEYAHKQMRSGKINEQQAQKFIDTELANIWTRSWEMLQVVTGLSMEGVSPWLMIKNFLAVEKQGVVDNVRYKAALTSEFVKNIPRRTREISSLVASRSMSYFLSSADIIAAKYEAATDRAAYALVEAVDSLTSRAEELAASVVSRGRDMRNYILVEAFVQLNDPMPQVIDHRFPPAHYKTEVVHHSCRDSLRASF
ncbi:MAG: hypothetical protein R3A80_09455 [Bdellovibrionota bacterium]